MKKVPKNLQGILWSVPVERLDLLKHESYVIHQILMYGNFDHIRWLFSTYPRKRIASVFLHKPQKIYTKAALNYVNKYILELDNKQLQEDKYVSTAH